MGWGGRRAEHTGPAPGLNNELQTTAMGETKGETAVRRAEQQLGKRRSCRWERATITREGHLYLG